MPKLKKPCRKGPGGTPCGNAKQGSRISPGECPRCWIERNTQFMEQPKHETVATTTRQTLPCIYLGKQLSEFDRPSCKRIYQCDNGYGEVCPNLESSHIRNAGRGCRGCGGYVPDTLSDV